MRRSSSGDEGGAALRAAIRERDALVSSLDDEGTPGPVSAATDVALPAGRPGSGAKNAVQPLRLGMRLPAVALSQQAGQQPEQVLLYFGIIDFLQVNRPVIAVSRVRQHSLALSAVLWGARGGSRASSQHAEHAEAPSPGLSGPIPLCRSTTCEKSWSTGSRRWCRTERPSQVPHPPACLALLRESVPRPPHAACMHREAHALQPLPPSRAIFPCAPNPQWWSRAPTPSASFASWTKSSLPRLRPLSSSSNNHRDERRVWQRVLALATQPSWPPPTVSPIQRSMTLICGNKVVWSREGSQQGRKVARVGGDAGK